MDVPEMERTNIMVQVKRLLNNEEGASAIEYALLVGLILAAILGAVMALGTKVAGTFTLVDSKLPS